MKLTRKLIPAFIMLLVSAVLMSTASFAWFAMNDTVTATGMEVTAKSDAVFLQIKGEGGSYGTTATDTTGPKELLPVAHDAFGSKAEIQPDQNKWFYQYSATEGSATAHDPFGKHYVPEANFANYVYKLTYNFQLDGDSAGETAYDLHVSSINIPADTGVKVIVEGPDGYDEFGAADDSIGWGETGATVLSNTVAKSGEIEVNVYIYIDGADENVTTTNLEAGSLENLAVSIGFKVYTQDHT